ncbi:MAG: UDP-N-acetylmuramate--L-alanine ligase [Rhodospirillales bacterium]|nr:UDP-N-acetylmuramate--L-alanine ligase [Rhodospirillales bacterium]MCB9996692.1 UDP-N-acetylmuramate--L-alanine ligase [Rhodospirillales bacterium]
MRTMPLETGTLHFVGIGGIGMSGIAEVLHDMGYSVQGSDLAEGPNVARLREKGITVFKGHDAANINGASVIVTSSAVRRSDNPEISAARDQKLPIVRRAEMLAELMRLKWAIAIGGTHGKTTTTSMVGAMLEEGGQTNEKLDPTVINGGIVNRYGTNTRLGKGEWMVAESDESDGTFTRLPATVAVVTNIDPEHMEHYGSFAAVRAAYRQFVENIPFYGFAVLCIDHPEVQALVADMADRRIITYGFNPQADVRADHLRFSAEGSTFDVTFADGQTIKDVFLSMPGEHNVQNALAALAIGRELEIAPPLMRSALQSFSGVKRRFTKTGIVAGITIIDDYGHHPVEIAAVLKTARQVTHDNGGKVIAVMQPHRYSRLHDLFDDFCTAFNDADTVIVADVYAAGEAPIEGADKAALAEGIRKCGHRAVKILENAEQLPQLAAEIAKEGDLIVCLGAGDITRWANALPGELGKIYQSARKQSA